MYVYALVEGGGPQDIPAGFDGKYDWDAIDDVEKAKRGWVRFQSIAFDVSYQKVVPTYTQNEDGVWEVSNEVTFRDDVTNVFEAYKAKVATRRYEESLKGVKFEDNVYQTDRESQALMSGKALAIQVAGADAADVKWKTADGFVVLTPAKFTEASLAVAHFIQAHYDREEAIVTAMASKIKVKTLLDAYNTEIDKDWPKTYEEEVTTP